MTMTSTLASTNSNLGYYQWKFEWKKKKKINSTKPFNLALEKYIEGVKQVLSSKEPIEQFSLFIIHQGLQLRMEAFKYLSSSKKSNTENSFEEAASSIAEIKSNKRLEILTENILFALRCNKKVIDGFSDLVEKPTAVSLEQTSNFMVLLQSSLYIEFVLIAADVINLDKKLKVTEEKINELAFLVADQAQTHLASAKELGFVKKRPRRKVNFDTELDATFIKEQKDLAEIGFDDFAKIFTS